jgi:soluble lytic murein transglycosylase-like protein
MRFGSLACGLAAAGLLSACGELSSNPSPDASTGKAEFDVGRAPSQNTDLSMAEGANAIARAKQYRSAIERNARENAVPLALANAVIRIESNFNAQIVHAGNYGLTQIRLATARSLGFDGPPSALLDPDTNLRFGLKYLGGAYQQAQGDLCGTIMKFQSGHLAVRMSSANRIYCQRVKALMTL